MTDHREKNVLRRCAPPSAVDAAMRTLSLQTEYHFGGYGKTTPELIDFMRRYRGTSLIRNGTPLQNHHEALGMVPL